MFSYTYTMNYKELKEILLKYYVLDSVKHLLAIKKPSKPSYKKAEILEEKHGIPIAAWKNIRLWLSEQEAKESKKENK